jgi:hypothetical protein
MMEANQMGGKKRSNSFTYDDDVFDDFDDFDDYDFEDVEIDGMKKHAKGFYSSEWDDLSGPSGKFSSRRKIERRNDLKKLYSEFDDYDELDLGNDW